MTRQKRETDRFIYRHTPCAQTSRKRTHFETTSSKDHKDKQLKPTTECSLATSEALSGGSPVTEGHKKNGGQGRSVYEKNGSVEL